MAYDEDHDVLRQLTNEVARIGERVASVRQAQDGAETRIREDIAAMDQRINGRITRVEREVGGVIAAQARAQGAAETLEHHNMPPERLPPPVGGQPAVEVSTTGPPRGAFYVTAITAGIATVIGAVAALVGALPQ